MFQSVDQAIASLEKEKYICSKEIATTVYLAMKLEKPILVEGPAGVGKTELGKVIASSLGMDLLRLLRRLLLRILVCHPFPPRARLARDPALLPLPPLSLARHLARAAC